MGGAAFAGASRGSLILAEIAQGVRVAGLPDRIQLSGFTSTTMMIHAFLIRLVRFARYLRCEGKC